MARDDGERGPQRRGRSPAGVDDNGAGMTVTDELTTLDLALDRGTRRLLELQHPEGWWVGELESNATMIAQHLFWLHVLRLRDPATDRKLANDLRARRRDDGTWSIWWEGPPDLSTTIEAYVALKMAGVDPGETTRAYIVREGGVPRSRVFTKCFLALLGQWPWQRIPTVPVEIILLPPGAPGPGFEAAAPRRAGGGWRGFMVEDDGRLRPEACQSPVWDTGLAVLALRAAGLPADHPQLRKAGEWLLAEEVTAKGDWSVRVPHVAPGGWAFEFANDFYPDLDDAAVIALALRELEMGRGAVERAHAWIAGMQSSNGGWGAFDVDNTSDWLYKIPFCDFGAVIDPPSEDVSAHALEATGA